MEHIKTIQWRDGRVRLVDQTKLPGELVHVETDDYRRLGESIKRLEVRGAPAIGVAGAMGVALAAFECDASSADELRPWVHAAAERLAATRPTAVNLSWAIARALRVLDDSSHGTVDEIRSALEAEAVAILDEDRELCRSIGRNGAALLADGDGVLTHCNAGGLATAEYGTALGVIYTAVEEGKHIRVFADETRPLLQGARLTAWELMQHGIDVTLLCDSAAASAMSRGWIDKVIVGADRIARNGDVANKIGTYPVALAARRHGLPFYVAAPYSTLDASLASGAEIPIEERSGEEVTSFDGCRTAPEGVATFNPAFDVTPAELVTAIITDVGVFEPPFELTLFHRR
ncbi:S-methyl-5-thioribose-1-phosphate isomerase [bacterium]|nr:S-methyl-5-thioribose-1-phosphate isomerase [bacterium]